MYRYYYDNGGNFTTTKLYNNNVLLYETNYTYDSNFSDLLTTFTKTEGGVTTTRTYDYTAPNGKTFVNPTTITETKNGTTTTRNLTWEQGRQLASISGVATYDYNENGLRTETNLADGTKRQYYYDGDRLDYVKFFNASGVLTCTLHYIYNSSGQAEYIQYLTA